MIQPVEQFLASNRDAAFNPSELKSWQVNTDRSGMSSQPASAGGPASPPREEWTRPLPWIGGNWGEFPEEMCSIPE